MRSIMGQISQSSWVILQHLPILTKVFLLSWLVLYPQTAFFATSFITGCLKAVGLFGSFNLPQLKSYFAFCVSLSPCFPPCSPQTHPFFWWLFWLVLFQNEHRPPNAETSKNLTGHALKAFLSFIGPSIIFALPKSLMVLSHTELKLISLRASICALPSSCLCTSFLSQKCNFLPLLNLDYLCSFKAVWILAALVLTCAIVCWSSYPKLRHTCALEWSGEVYVRRMRSHLLTLWWVGVQFYPSYD